MCQLNQFSLRGRQLGGTIGREGGDVHKVVVGSGLVAVGGKEPVDHFAEVLGGEGRVWGSLRMSGRGHGLL